MDRERTDEICEDAMRRVIMLREGKRSSTYVETRVQGGSCWNNNSPISIGAI